MGAITLTPTRARLYRWYGTISCAAPQGFPPSITRSWLVREGRGEKMESSGMAEGRGMSGDKQNKAQLHQLVLDGP